ncbi:DNA-binding response regulator [Dokdonia ponticola]|uniref:DNA-binding response regulator n=1 Tax=Dokdonia ponticola TaxID=2041041 RepID=A0ABV9HYC6_9FLAO
METTSTILIIEDHQLIIDVYKNAITQVMKEVGNTHFSIEISKTCVAAYQKIIKASTNQEIDIVFLDIQVPQDIENNLMSGEDLGIVIRKRLPQTKIIVITNLMSNLRLHTILKNIDPDGLLIKNDIVFEDLTTALRDVMGHKTFYSQKVISLLRKKMHSDLTLDQYDIRLLYELSNGARMKDLLSILPFSKAGIEKRKRLLKLTFNVNHEGDRELILKARENGFI